ncbi:NF-X-like 1 [Striga asiatica]|uniref:NF-X-like 1 n=1 Tax=Striga asiatica TaxID=4170 RepID=A0A5A7QFF9_STRAF|nr:NF-X-like 1 [Striga asiatica]
MSRVIFYSLLFVFALLFLTTPYLAQGAEDDSLNPSFDEKTKILNEDEEIWSLDSSKHHHHHHRYHPGAPSPHAHHHYHAPTPHHHQHHAHAPSSHGSHHHHHHSHAPSPHGGHHHHRGRHHGHHAHPPKKATTPSPKKEMSRVVFYSIFLIFALVFLTTPFLAQGVEDEDSNPSFGEKDKILNGDDEMWSLDSSKHHHYNHHHRRHPGAPSPHYHHRHHHHHAPAPHGSHHHHHAHAPSPHGCRHHGHAHPPKKATTPSPSWI